MENRPRGRPPLRWFDCVAMDIKILKIKNWKKVAKIGDTLKRLLEGPPKGCRTTDEEEDNQNFILLPTHPAEAKFVLSVQGRSYRCIYDTGPQVTRAPT
ncbi:hypothetical protein TNCV_4427731 [Trichonephila clavipes]|nr:hypothetical protein TNCV_4427731 [Trichonephila clavipes]